MIRPCGKGTYNENCITVGDVICFILTIIKMKILAGMKFIQKYAYFTFWVVEVDCTEDVRREKHGVRADTRKRGTLASDNLVAELQLPFADSIGYEPHEYLERS